MFNRSRFDRSRFDRSGVLAPGPPPPPYVLLRVALVSALGASAALAEALGDGADGVYPAVIPEAATLPAVSYRFASARRVTCLAGAAGLATVRVRMTIRSTDDYGCETIREVLRNLLFGFIGDLGGANVCFVRLDDESDDYEPPIAFDAGTHVKTLDFSFKYREPVPTLS